MLEEIFLKAYQDNQAAFKTGATAFCIWLIAFLSSKFGFEIDTEKAALYGGVLAGGIAWFIAQVVVFKQREQGKRVQELANNIATKVVPTVDVDGRIGDHTLGSLETAVDVINALTRDMPKPQEKELKREVSAQQTERLTSK